MPVKKRIVRKKKRKLLPKKTELGRKRDYAKNSNEKHEIAYRKRRKKTKSKK